MVYKLQTGITHAKRKLSALAVGITALVFPAVLVLSGGAANAVVSNNYSLFGDASLVHPGYNSPTAAQFESSTTVAPGYGGIDFGVPSGISTVSDLNNLSTEYMFVHGSCGGGAPRFSVEVTTPSNGTQSIFVYIGLAPSYTGCPPNVWSNTGNLAAPTNLVDATQLGGGFYEPYSAVQTTYGSYPITDISLVTDSDWFTGNNPQTVQADNVQINNNTYTFEGKNSCKDGGWQQFTSSPGPFKNQGDCVSYFATDGKNQ